MKKRCAIGAVVAATAISIAANGAEVKSRVHIFPNPGADAYVLVAGDNSVSANESVEQVLRVRERYSGDLLWFRRHGTSYLVRDAALLGRARALFDPLRALEPEQSALSRRQRLVEKKEEAIDSELDEMEDAADDASDLQDGSFRDPGSERRMKDLEAERKVIHSESRRLEAEESALDRRSDDLERAAETKLWALIDQCIADGSAQKTSDR